MPDLGAIVSIILGDMLRNEAAQCPPYVHTFRPPEPDSYDAYGRAIYLPKPTFTLTQRPPAWASRLPPGRPDTSPANILFDLRTLKVVSEPPAAPVISADTARLIAHALKEIEGG